MVKQKCYVGNMFMSSLSIHCMMFSTEMTGKPRGMLLARTQDHLWLTLGFITRSTYNTRKEIPHSNCSHNT